MHTILQIGQVTDQSVMFINKIKDLGYIYVPKIIGAIVVYIIGAFVIKKLARMLQRTMVKEKYDPSLQSFLYSFAKITLTVLLLLSILGMLGVDITAFSALLVGLSLAIGAALNGSLGNFAGGVMMLIFKPFKVGDKIEAQGVNGRVLELGIFNTVILSADNKTIILANGPLSTGTIINYTAHGSLRVELVMAIAGDDDIERARAAALAAMVAYPTVLKNPAPEVHVQKVADGMVVLAIWPYSLEQDYWDVYFGVQEAVKLAWDKAGVVAPIPHVVQINK